MQRIKEVQFHNLSSVVEIWIGGSGSLALQRSQRGIVMMENLMDMVNALKKYEKTNVVKLLQGIIFDQSETIFKHCDENWQPVPKM